MQHELRYSLLANARLSYTDNRYQVNNNSMDPDDGQGDVLKGSDVIRAEAGLIYLVNRHVFISGGYMYEKQDANASGFNYNTNRWFLTLGLEL